MARGTGGHGPAGARGCVPGRRWAVILAGGDGLRLRPLTTALVGDGRPKQFCPVLGPDTLLEQTRRRVALSVAPHRTLVAVTRAHERFYAPLLAHLPSSAVVAQPENRGTAPVILYSLMRLATAGARDVVALFPSDHSVSDDYCGLPVVDFSRQVLAARAGSLAVLPVAGVRWSDLGDPSRVQAVRGRLRAPAPREAAALISA